MWIFSTLGGGLLVQIHTFIKVWKKGCFLPLFEHFCLFLTLFDRKISGNFLHFGGVGGSGTCRKNPHFLFFLSKASRNNLTSHQESSFNDQHLFIMTDKCYQLIDHHQFSLIATFKYYLLVRILLAMLTTCLRILQLYSF